MTEDIPVSRVFPNPNQPRKTFPKHHIESLAESIAEKGLLQAIVVRPVGRRYQIVAGECRWRAHIVAKLKTIRCDVRVMTDQEVAVISIVENLRRLDMNPIEEANAFQNLLGSGYTIPRIVKELGLSGPVLVQNRLNLLQLDATVQSLIISGNLSASMATALAWAPAEHHDRILREIRSGRLNTVEKVRHAAIAVRDASEQLDAFAAAPRASKEDVAALSHLEQQIETISAMVEAGFKKGECIAARKVSAQRLISMADKLLLMRKHIIAMEHDLRCAASASSMVQLAFA